MSRNVLINSKWVEEDGDFPKHYKCLGKLHFNQCRIEGARVCSLNFIKPDQEILKYQHPILLRGAHQVTIGLIIRANDVDCVNYHMTFYDHQNQQIDHYYHNVAHEINHEFKNVCVTYQIPKQAVQATIEWEIKGIATALTLFRPNLSKK